MQDEFGICGTTSIIYMLLNQGLKGKERVDQLFIATFSEVLNLKHRVVFLTAKRQRFYISLRYLSRKFARMVDNYVVTTAKAKEIRDTRYNDHHHATITPTFFVDYCLSRALGYLLWKQDPERYYSEKFQFNNEFSAPGKLRTL